ncbi:PaaI family thioesterase [Chromobacterium violaceum]|uniref:PaaI family thioesterase n=1 Tax=Chromobacterium violaceum TaxID=536 RepID=UPI001FD46286|nr:PaaI family thioesterase [Chromobacterium violaceum]
MIFVRILYAQNSLIKTMYMEEPMEKAPLLLETVEQAVRILQESPFVAIWNYKVLSVQAGAVALALPAQPQFYRPGGIIQGGCLMTLADTAFWLAAMTELGIDAPIVTLEMKTNFLRAAQADVYCRAEVMKSGRRVTYGTATITDAAGQMLSHHTLTYLAA